MGLPSKFVDNEIGNDIADKKAIRFAALASHIGIWEWDIGTNVLSWNESMYKLYGVKSSEFTGPREAWQKGIHPEDRERQLEDQQKAFQRENDFYSEFRVVWPDKTIRYIKSQVIVLRNEKGKLVKIVGINWDITDQKLAEEALQKSESFVKMILSNIPDMVGYWTKDLRCLFANQGYLKWFGRTVEQMRGIRIQDLMGPELFAKNEPYIRAVLSGEDQEFERTLIKPNGETGYTWAKYIAHKIDGKVQGFFVLVTDVTEIKKLEQDLKIAHDKLENKIEKRTAELLKINKELQTEIMARKIAERTSRKLGKELNHLNRLFLFDEMSTSIIHQLSQPLGAIVNNASAAKLLISKKGSVKDTAGILSDILKDCERTRDIIDKNRGLLKRNEYVFKEFDLVLSIKNVVDLVQSHILLNNVSLILEISNSIIIKGDKVHLEQVLLNLIMNAIESIQETSKKEQSKKELIVRTDLNTLRKVIISVKDSGRGFSKEVERNLFKPFFTTKQAGLGLGLPICRSIIETHYGKFWGENNPGNHGATFYFSLPIIKNRKK